MRRFLIILAAVLPLAFVGAACDGGTGLGEAPLTSDTSVVLRSPSAPIGGASAVDARGLVLVLPERPESAGQWDFALRQSGNTFSVVARMERGVAIVSILSHELLLAVLLRDGVGFAPLLGEIDARRASLADLV